MWYAGTIASREVNKANCVDNLYLDSEVWKTFGSPEVGWPRENDSCMQGSALCLELSDPQTNENPSTPVKDSGPAVFVQSCL